MDSDGTQPVKRPLPSLSPTTVLALLPPYPIVLVTTRTNAITVNQVTYLTFEPLRIGVGIAHSRYTHGLLHSEKAFVINVPTASMLQAVRACGTLSGRAGSKFVAAGIDPEPSSEVEAVSIAQCGAHIECRVERVIPFERRDWFVGRVVAARCRPEHDGADGLLCGRHHYALAQTLVGPR
jgi:flavin reductase (DIM6/NTAB) family NADH-FMN oxidoreductase RutF